MADALAARSALQGLLAPGRHGCRSGSPGIVLSEVAGVALVSVLARKGRDAEIDEKVRRAFGCSLPDRPRTSVAGNLAFLWSGPGQWLARAEEEFGGDLMSRLASIFGENASLSEQSDGRAVVRLGGPRARDALAKLCPIDLHPRSFRPGDVALTHVGHISALLWQVDETPVYEIAVLRAFDESFLEALLAACAEFGCDVPDRH